jgi:hypothetical protein
MAFALSQFQSALASGGARPSLFDLTITGTPAGVTDTNLESMKYFCTVSALPPLTVTPIERFYFGRTVKIPGDMVFGDLSTTIIQTEGGKERTELEKWMQQINHTGTNIMNTAHNTSNGFAADVTLTQYGKEGSTDVLQTIDFVDAWPSSIGPITLSYDTASEIAQYDVTWTYNYYEFGKPTT